MGISASRHRWALPAALASLLVAGAATAAPIDPDAPTGDWTAVSYPSLLPDYSDDQQTGIPEADIVGDDTTPALYMHFDHNDTVLATDGTLSFRVRVGADKNPPGFNQFFAIGIDADLDGALDLFLGVDNGGSSDQIGIFDAGGGLNISPDTTSIVSTPLYSYTETLANYDFSPVDGTIDPGAPTDLDGDGDTDYLLSFSVPFQDVVNALAAQGISFDDTQPYTLVAGTSTQPNALNQDLGGPDGGTDSSQSWADLGAVSDVTTPLAAVPEPNTGTLLSLGLVAVAALKRRRPGH